MEKVINISVRDGGSIPLDRLNFLQDDLKEITDENKAKLKKEIVDTGFAFKPHVWCSPNDLTLYLLDGHHRILVLRELQDDGYHVPLIPIDIVDADDIEAARRRVLQASSSYAKITEHGLSNFSINAKLNPDDIKMSFDLPSIDMDKFKEAFSQISSGQEIGVSAHTRVIGLINDDEIPEPENQETDIQLGDVFSLGDHRLVCGDSTDPCAVDLLMMGEKADMVFTDPPYGINAVSKDGKVGGGTAHAPAKTYRQILGDENTNVARDFYSLISSLEISKIIIWGGNYFTDFLPPKPCWIVWDKERPEGLTFADGEIAWTNFTSPLKFIRHRWDGYHRASERDQPRVHPTQKPSALAEWCFNEYGNVEDKILDLFGGSGSTLIACEKTNRKCFMMEIDPYYCQVIINRWEAFTGQKAEKLVSGPQ